MSRYLKWPGIFFVVLIIIIQFIPVDRTNPPVVQEPNWDSPQTRTLAKRACFDCHSNETKWPWYAYVAPVSWMIAHDVHEARGEFNMSNWRPGDGDEAAEEVREGHMPLPKYLKMHPEAYLTDTERETFLKGLKATFEDY